MASFLIGSMLTGFICAGMAVRDNELINGYIAMYLIGYAVITISTFGISIACLTSKKQLHHWIDRIEEENNLGDFKEEDVESTITIG